LADIVGSLWGSGRFKKDGSECLFNGERLGVEVQKDTGVHVHRSV